MAGRPKRRAMMAAVTALGGERAILEMVGNGMIFPEIAEVISQLMADDGYDGIDRRQLGSWLNRSPDSRTALARAREASADSLADEALSEARGTVEGNARSTQVRIRALQWQASKRDRVKYGDDQVVSAELNIRNIFLDSLRQSNAELQAILASESTELSPALTSVEAGDMAQVEASDEG